VVGFHVLIQGSIIAIAGGRHGRLAEARLIHPALAAHRLTVSGQPEKCGDLVIQVAIMVRRNECLVLSVFEFAATDLVALAQVVALLVIRTRGGQHQLLIVLPHIAARQVIADRVLVASAGDLGANKAIRTAFLGRRFPAFSLSAACADAVPVPPCGAALGEVGHLCRDRARFPVGDSQDVLPCLAVVGPSYAYGCGEVLCPGQGKGQGHGHVERRSLWSEPEEGAPGLEQIGG